MRVKIRDATRQWRPVGSDKEWRGQTPEATPTAPSVPTAPLDVTRARKVAADVTAPMGLRLRAYSKVLGHHYGGQ